MRREFVGRAAELQRLEDWRTHAASGSGSLVILSGIAGIGKSALLREFVDHHPESIFRIAASDEFSQTALSTWHALTGHQPAPSVASELDDERIPNTYGLAQEFLDELLNSASRSRREGSTEPVIVAIENLQWCDPTSQRQVAQFARLSRRSSVLIVATQRHELSGDPGAQLTPELELEVADRIGLAGLGTSDLRDLLSQRYPSVDPTLLLSASAHLDKLTGGNPLAVAGILDKLSGRGEPSEVLGTALRLDPEFVHVNESLSAALEIALSPLSPTQQRMLGVGVLAGSLQISTIAVLVPESDEEIGEAIQAASECGVLDQTQTPPIPTHPLLAARLAGAVPIEAKERVHAQLFANCTAGPPSQWSDGVRHGQLSGGVVPVIAIMELAVKAGMYQFEIQEFDDAQGLLGLATEAHSELPSVGGIDFGDILISRAIACEKLGRLDTAQALFARAAQAPELRGDPDRLAQAAIGFAFPPSWQVGATRQALEFIAAARTAGASGSTQITLDALASMLELNSPKAYTRGEEWAWFVHPERAQPLAEDALARARKLGDDDATIYSLIAWRWTHNSPAALCQRLQTSQEAVRLASRLNDPRLLSEACVRLVADCVEASDRTLANEALSVLDWASTHHLDYRLIWRGHVLQGLIASADEDWDSFDQHIRECQRITDRIAIPGGAVVAEMQLTHRAILLGESGFADRIRGPLHDLVETHPLAMAMAATSLATAGDATAARPLVERAIMSMNPESTYLHSLSWVARACVAIGESDLARRLLPLLEPWLDRCSVDGESVVSLGPIGLAAAPVAQLVGDSQLAERAKDEGTVAAARLCGDITTNHPCKATVDERAPEPLTAREHDILALMADGLTNQQIARRLAFSLATVRRDTISIYRKLHVQGRANAVAKASTLGIISTTN